MAGLSVSRQWMGLLTRHWAFTLEGSSASARAGGLINQPREAQAGCVLRGATGYLFILGRDWLSTGLSAYLSWLCHSALYELIGHVFVGTQHSNGTHLSQANLRCLSQDLFTPSYVTCMPVGATDNMELPPGSPQLDVRAARMYGRGLYWS